MKQLSRLAKELFALRATEFMRRDGTDKAMASGRRITLHDQFSPGGECRQLAPQPSQHPPDSTVSEGPFVNVALARRRYIACRSVAGTHCFSIGLSIILDISGGQTEQRWTRVAFIREYENRDNR
jgi:hypothetical protein